MHGAWHARTTWHACISHISNMHIAFSLGTRLSLRGRSNCPYKTCSSNYSGKLSGCRPQCFHWGHTCRPQALARMITCCLCSRSQTRRSIDFTRRFSITSLTTRVVQMNFFRPFICLEASSLRDREQRQQVIILVNASS